MAPPLRRSPPLGGDLRERYGQQRSQTVPGFPRRSTLFRMGRCTVSLLGSFEVRVDGSPVPPDAWRSRRAADLVKLLALEPGHELHREVVMDLLWPELGTEAAGANLRKAVHYARRAMQAEEAIRTKGGMLSLWGAGVEVDALRFLDAADLALAAGDPESCGLAAD